MIQTHQLQRRSTKVYKVKLDSKDHLLQLLIRSACSAPTRSRPFPGASRLSIRRRSAWRLCQHEAEQAREPAVANLAVVSELMLVSRTSLLHVIDFLPLRTLHDLVADDGSLAVGYQAGLLILLVLAGIDVEDASRFSRCPCGMAVGRSP